MRQSNLAKSTERSAIREMFNATVGMSDLLNFSVGEPDFITAEPIIAKCCEEWKKGKTHYTANSGVKSLRNSIAEYHKNDLCPDPEKNIIITAGAGEALQLTLLSIINPGEEVMVFTPSWPNYFGQIALAHGIPNVVETKECNNFMPDPHDIKRKLNKNTKVIMLNSPSNPTGSIITRECMDEIAQIIRENDLLVISDEVYRHIRYESEDHVSITDYNDIRDKIIFINSFSKMFAMTGWRVGYAISNDDILIANMVKLHEYGVSCLPEPIQLSAEFAIKNCMQEIEVMRAEYFQRREMVYAGINSIKGMSCHNPAGAFYCFVNIREFGLLSSEFCMELLRQTGCVTVPGSGFGKAGEGYFRLSYATSRENIIEGIKRMRIFANDFWNK